MSDAQLATASRETVRATSSQTNGVNATSLSAENISVRFGGLAALSNVTLRLVAGEAMGLIGPNGAGKTTLVNCLSGFQRPTSGGVYVDGVDTTGWSPARFCSEGVARTFQTGRLFKNLSVLENVEVSGVAMGLDRHSAKDRAFELLERLGIARHAQRKAGELPYTDERRISIARALAIKPRFLLLDEPAAGMTDVECDELIDFIGTIPQEFGCGVVLIEHNMRVVMGVCKKILVMDGGTAIACGTPTEIQENAAVIAAYLGGDPE